jgi:hypothetical protein
MMKFFAFEGFAVWFDVMFFYVDMLAFLRIEYDTGVTIVFDSMFGRFLS